MININYSLSSIIFSTLLLTPHIHAIPSPGPSSSISNANTKSRQDLAGRADEMATNSNNTDIYYSIPSHSKIKIMIDNVREDDPIQGPEDLSVAFNFDNLDNSRIVDERWVQQNFTWLIYDSTVGEEQEMDDERDIRFEMNCSFQASVINRFPEKHTFTLDTTEPYVHPAEDKGETWDQIVSGANIICPEGECVYKGENGCGKMKMPKWDQKFLEDWRGLV